MVYLYVEFFPSHQRNEVMPFAVVIFSELSQPQKDKYVLLVSVLHRFYTAM